MPAPFDLAETDRLLSTTRSVRRRLDLDRPVEREVLLECVRLSQQAPTPGNAQSWQWVVVLDPAKRAALAEIYRKTSTGYLAQRRSASEADPQSLRVHDSAAWLADHLERVPAHVIPCVKGRVGTGAPAFVDISTMAGIFPAVWSFQLALRARGLGSTLTTLHLPCADEAAELLGIPDGVVQVALLPVAYTVGTDFSLARRPPPETIVHWDGWGATSS